jgi:hypothetical protein
MYIRPLSHRTTSLNRPTREFEEKEKRNIDQLSFLSCLQGTSLHLHAYFGYVCETILASAHGQYITRRFEI